MVVCTNLGQTELMAESYRKLTKFLKKSCIKSHNHRKWFFCLFFVQKVANFLKTFKMHLLTWLDHVQSSLGWKTWFSGQFSEIPITSAILANKVPPVGAILIWKLYPHRFSTAMKLKHYHRPCNERVEQGQGQTHCREKVDATLKKI